MLMPKTVQQYMKHLNKVFREKYEEVLSEMMEVMEERGAVRDKDTPIYLRRSPEENLGIAHGKVYRVESLLHQISQHGQVEHLLIKVVEECIDIANYVIFIAALCLLALEDVREAKQ